MVSNSRNAPALIPPLAKWHLAWRQMPAWLRQDPPLLPQLLLLLLTLSLALLWSQGPFGRQPSRNLRTLGMSLIARERQTAHGTIPKVNLTPVLPTQPLRSVIYLRTSIKLRLRLGYGFHHPFDLSMGGPMASSKSRMDPKGVNTIYLPKMVLALLNNAPLHSIVRSRGNVRQIPYLSPALEPLTTCYWINRHSSLIILSWAGASGWVTTRLLPSLVTAQPLSPSMARRFSSAIVSMYPTYAFPFPAFEPISIKGDAVSLACMVLACTSSSLTLSWKSTLQLIATFIMPQSDKHVASLTSIMSYPNFWQSSRLGNGHQSQPHPCNYQTR